jgi:hypothetical protein
MLVANRDPHHSGAHEISSRKSDRAPRFAHAMSVLQVVGTLLAIPVGIGSAYTMYRSNFTVEATCQSLRSNIVGMLDKSVDAATRHMLLRRDVEAFESACRSVDPDATAAFKALLVADKAATPVKAVSTKPAEVRSPVAVKQTAAVPPAVKTEAPAAARETSSDAVWVAAVRQALINRPAEPKPAAEQVKATAVTPAPVVESEKPLTGAVTLTPPVAQEVRPSVEQQSQPVTIAAPPPVAVAPPLVIVPAAQADDGHPVPPAPIPEAAPTPARGEAPTRSRLGEFAAKIPLVGWAINR